MNLAVLIQWIGKGVYIMTLFECRFSSDHSDLSKAISFIQLGKHIHVFCSLELNQCSDFKFIK